MRPEPIDANNWQRHLPTIVVAAAATIGLFPFLAGIVGTGVFAVVLSPVFHALRPYTGRRAAALVAVGAAVVLLVLPAAWLLLLMSTTAPDIVRQIGDSGTAQRLATVRIGDLRIGDYLGDATAGLLAWLSRQMLHLAGSVTHHAINGVIALFGLYYVLLDGNNVWRAMLPHLPVTPAVADRLRLRFDRVTKAMLYGVVATAAVQGSIVGLAFWLVDLSHPVFWGTIAGAASIVPTLGAALIWAPGVLTLILAGDTGHALVLASIGLLLISTIDNFIRPLIYQRVSQIHPLVTILGAFAGLHWLGVLGLLVGPLILCYGVELHAAVRPPTSAAMPVPRADSGVGISPPEISRISV